jgi:DNA-binding MarR family transcriptional regulator
MPYRIGAKMYQKEITRKLLEVLRDRGADVPYYVGSGELSARLSLTRENIKDHVQELSSQGYVEMVEGFEPLFIVKLTEKGFKSLDV